MSKTFGRPIAVSVSLQEIVFLSRIATSLGEGGAIYLWIWKRSLSFVDVHVCPKSLGLTSRSHLVLFLRSHLHRQGLRLEDVDESGERRWKFAHARVATTVRWPIRGGRSAQSDVVVIHRSAEVISPTGTTSISSLNAQQRPVTTLSLVGRTSLYLPRRVSAGSGGQRPHDTGRGGGGGE